MIVQEDCPMCRKESRKLMSDTSCLVIGIVLVSLGVLLLGGTIGRNITCSQEVVAEVVDVIVDESRHWKGTQAHYPVLTYVVNGKRYTVESEEYTRNMDKYKTGEETVIWCNPDHPEEIRLGVSIGAFLVGVVPVIIGGILIYVYVRYC